MIGAGRPINPPARRRPRAAPPAVPPPVIATWVVSFAVSDAMMLFREATKQMAREGAGEEEIASSLTTNGTVDVGSCLRVLMAPLDERLSERARVEITDTDLYIEPATETP